MKQNSTSLILTVPRAKNEQWGLPDGTRIPFRFGSLHGEATVEQTAGQGEGAVNLQWPGGYVEWQYEKVGGELRYTPEDGVRIGPVVGIMVKSLRRDPKHPVPASALHSEFVRGARTLNMICFVFSASEVDWGRKVVRGATLVGRPGRETWKVFQFPLPDVVYNRVSHRGAENSEAVVHSKGMFAKLQIPLFNNRFLNKQEMYDWLLADERSVDLIPATGRMTTPEVLESFLRQHNMVYLKPIGGSLGMGICQAFYEGGVYLLRYKSKGKYTTKRFQAARALYRFVKQVYPNRSYVMQQGVHLKRYEGNATDFRVHLHKNGQGEWEAAGIGAKIAGAGSVTTHVHNGGHVLAGDHVLNAWFGAKAQAMRQRLVDVSIRAATVAEGLFNGPVGELGIDAGIDEKGRIWIFETNAKPGRSIFKHLELKDAGKRSAKLIMEYASFLAGYVKPGGGKE